VRAVSLSLSPTVWRFQNASILRGRRRHFIGEPVEGHEVHTPGAQVWEFEKGKVSRVRILADSEALAEPREVAPPREEERTEERGEEDAEAGAEERGEAEEGKR
jgi:hypothetical protein